MSIKCRKGIENFYQNNEIIYNVIIFITVENEPQDPCKDINCGANAYCLVTFDGKTRCACVEGYVLDPNKRDPVCIGKYYIHINR